MAALSGLAVTGGTIAACTGKAKPQVQGKLLGPSFKAGHLLRKGINVVPTETEEQEVVIVGGGASGLAAARWLKKHSDKNILLLELENETGGNSAAGKNEQTAYPWGAHYLPLPNNSFTELLDFLQETNVITGYDAKGLPIYNEYYLCFDPEERLYINNYWQEGLVPRWGVPENDLQQIERFQQLTEELKQAKGIDGKYAFDIPVDHSSADAQYRDLDQLTMLEWLQQHELTSEYLHWYVDYACRDDFGSALAHTSAWAGIHYFASRKAEASNSEPHRILTWPEGNNWLVQRLRESCTDRIRTNAMVYRVGEQDGKVAVDYMDLRTQKYKRILAEQCIMATPQFVNQRLLSALPELLSTRNLQSFEYVPWLVANLTLKDVPHGKGLSLCWDNVIYGSKSLGYVYANHQQVALFPEKKTITFYHALADEAPAAARGKAYGSSYEDWKAVVLQELEKAHPGIQEQVEQLDVWVWGHGMIYPKPGFIWSEDRQQAGAPYQNKLYFAHTDLSGISVFEEAFYRGITAARQLLNTERA
ncbi:FAD-dependent oxidoreductase [Pontibacter ruber]|uniref:FAD-dependent oxidoreductase n=1 Tax=Pontibacter ruber TaxID=1343895 RepID=A0ABW5CU64_9BACT|nr:FAD-dependent oxidoreductase [Pontibacter ruber]